MSGPLLPGRAGETRLALGLLGVASALETLAEDTVMLVAVVSAVACVRSRMRRRAQAG